MSPQCVAFGRAAISLGLATREVVSSCAQRLAPDAPPGALRDLLVSSGVITTDDARAIDTSVDGELTRASSRSLSSSSSSSRTSTLLPNVGEKLGPYRVTGVLGAGGMGAVLQGVHEEMQLDVALKFLLARAQLDPDAVARFEREIEAMTKVAGHPNVARVRGAGRYGAHGLPYVVMDLVQGSDLAQVLAAGPLKVADALALVEKVARAVHHCHEHGVVHRDLKPANVLLRRDDEPVVTDFGLAVDQSSQDRLTQTGELLGTAAYMAPEQANAKKLEQDRRTDVYALGAILFQCLTGQPPFVAASQLAVMRKILVEPAPAPSSLVPTLSPDVDAVVACCLAKDRESRYRTARALAEDLARLRSGEAVSVRPRAAGERLRASLAKHATVAILASILVVGSAATGVGYLVARARAETEKLARERIEAADATLLAALRDAGVPFEKLPERAPALVRADAALAELASVARGRAADLVSRRRRAVALLRQPELVARGTLDANALDAPARVSEAAAAIGEYARRRDPSLARAAHTLLAGSETSADATIALSLLACFEEFEPAALVRACQAAAANEAVAAPWRVALRHGWATLAARTPGAKAGKDVVALARLVDAAVAADPGLAPFLAERILASDRDPFLAKPGEPPVEHVLASERLVVGLLRSRAVPADLASRLEVRRDRLGKKLRDLVTTGDGQGHTVDSVLKTLERVHDVAFDPDEQLLHAFFIEVGIKWAHEPPRDEIALRAFAIGACYGHLAFEILGRVKLGAFEDAPRLFGGEVARDPAALVALGIAAVSRLRATLMEIEFAERSKRAGELRETDVARSAFRRIETGIAELAKRDDEVARRLRAAGKLALADARTLELEAATKPGDELENVDAAIVAAIEALAARHPRELDVRRALASWWSARAELLTRLGLPGALTPRSYPEPGRSILRAVAVSCCEAAIAERLAITGVLARARALLANATSGAGEHASSSELAALHLDGLSGVMLDSSPEYGALLDAYWTLTFEAAIRQDFLAERRLELLDRALELAPHRRGEQLERGGLLEILGRKQEALATYRRVVEEGDGLKQLIASEYGRSLRDRALERIRVLEEELGPPR